MKDYQKQYYDYQTIARGILTKDELEKQHIKISKWYASRIGKYLPVNLDARCLDVPCGYGNFLYYLKSKGYRNILGIDSDVNQIRLNKMLDLSAKIGDAFESLANSSEQYHCISSLDFLEHLSKDDALSFLTLCYERLKPDGVLILRTPCADGPFGVHDICNDLTHRWGMTSNLLNAILMMKGFERINILDERPQPTSFVNTFRWLIFYPSRVIMSLACVCLGLSPPKIWSRSMIAVAYKPRF